MKVQVYSRNDDPYSHMLKNILKSNNISFENIEVSRDKTAFGKMVELSGQQNTPVLVIDGKVYCGFDHALIKNVLTTVLQAAEKSSQETTFLQTETTDQQQPSSSKEEQDEPTAT